MPAKPLQMIGQWPLDNKLHITKLLESTSLREISASPPAVKISVEKIFVGPRQT